jgi:hypothetical protein
VRTPPPLPPLVSSQALPISYTPLDTQCYVNEQWVQCSSRWTNVKESLDIFILGHFFGWWCKATLFRHAGISWAVSVGFELVELSFQHWLPNFYECWWDHIILDVLVCNAVGIVLGTLTCRYFSMKSCAFRPRFCRCSPTLIHSLALQLPLDLPVAQSRREKKAVSCGAAVHTVHLYP